MQLKKISSVTFPRPIPLSFFKDNRKRYIDFLRASPKINTETGFLFLKGPSEIPRYDDDATLGVNIEPFFFYLFGIVESETYAIIDFKTEKATVFVKVPEPSHAFWENPKNFEEFKTRYQLDDVKPLNELENYIRANCEAKDFVLYLNYGKRKNSQLCSSTPKEDFKDLLSNFNVDETTIYEYSCETRIIKTSQEIEIMKDSVELTTLAHQTIMKSITPGISEAQISNLFSSIRLEYGAEIAYGNIVCAGHNCCYLHYDPNEKVFFKDGDLILIDSAVKVGGYCSDITRTYPANGKFTQRQKDIYNIVLEAQIESMAASKAGVLYQDTHILAEKILLAGLIRLGLVKGDLETAWLKRAIYYFMPHGLGHYIGLYTHDLPGLAEKENNWKPYPKMGIPIKRVLENGMVITVEPGIYFNRVLLKQGYEDPEVGPLLAQEVIELYIDEVGGVRIEDMIVVRDNGFELLSGDLIKTVDEIEDFMKRD
jgi:Xaa-Pro dipeptidase